MDPKASKPRAKRDPEGRKRAIVEAAAALLLEEGSERVTHRRVAERAEVPLGSTTQYFADIHDLKRAGYELISQGVMESYREYAEQMAAAHDDVEALARYTWGYLADETQVRADMALYMAALKDPTLRELAQQGHRVFIDTLSKVLPESQTLALDAFIDGLIAQKCLYAMEFDKAFLRKSISALLSIDSQ